MKIPATILFSGSAKGEVFVLSEPISFWGGVDLKTGRIVDVYHPQEGLSIKNSVLVLPGTKGSTAGPGALLELICNGNGPLAILLSGADSICVIGAQVASYVSDRRVPILYIEDKSVIANGDIANIVDGELSIHGGNQE